MFQLNYDWWVSLIKIGFRRVLGVVFEVDHGVELFFLMAKDLIELLLLVWSLTVNIIIVGHELLFITQGISFQLSCLPQFFIPNLSLFIIRHIFHIFTSKLFQIMLLLLFLLWIILHLLILIIKFSLIICTWTYCNWLPLLEIVFVVEGLEFVDG